MSAGKNLKKRFLPMETGLIAVSVNYLSGETARMYSGLSRSAEVSATGLLEKTSADRDSPLYILTRGFGLSSLRGFDHETFIEATQNGQLRFLHMFPRSVRSAMFIDVW